MGHFCHVSSTLSTCSYINVLSPCFIGIELIITWITNSNFTFNAKLQNLRVLRGTLVAQYLTTTPTVMLKICPTRSTCHIYCTLKLFISSRGQTISQTCQTNLSSKCSKLDLASVANIPISPIWSLRKKKELITTLKLHVFFKRMASIQSYLSQT